MIAGLVLGIFLAALCVPPAFSQAPGTASIPSGQVLLTGIVTDPSGAVVPGAKVTLLPEGVTWGISRLSGATGEFTFPSQAARRYVLRVEAPGFAPFDSAPFRLSRARAKTLNVQLKMQEFVQHVTVSDEDAIGADPNRNGDAVVLRQADIDRLPLEPAELLLELQGLAGSPDAALYVDGYSGNKLPPISSIREVRINQNPYSAQNDTSPQNGVIQVFTKPGAEKITGQIYLFGDDSALNAQNPLASQPPYYVFALGGYLNGPLPLSNKKASYSVGLDQDNINLNSLISAQALDANLNQVAVNQAIASPVEDTNISPKIDFRAGPNSTVTVKYIFDRNTLTNAGTGQLNLASQAYNSAVYTQTLQASETQIIGAKIVNEARFQFIRARTSQAPASTRACARG